MKRGPASGTEFTFSSPLRSFAATFWRVLVKPGAFFGNIPRTGDVNAPLVYAVCCRMLSVLLLVAYTLLISAVSGNPLSEAAPDFVGGFEANSLVLLAVFLLLLVPLFALLTLYLTAAIFHVLVTIFVGRNAGFVGTFRANAYATTVSVASWIPFVRFLASLYGLYIFSVGLREVHSATGRQAVLVVAAPAAFVVVSAALSLLAVLGLR